MNRPPTTSFPAEALTRVDAERAVDALLLHAANLQCSDLFLVTNEDSVEIQVRRMGQIEPVSVVPSDRGRHMIGHIRAMAGMNIAEPMRPQDGRWLHRLGDRQLDIRINIIHTVFGVDMVLRIWDRDAKLKTLDQLGLAGEELQTLSALLQRPSGLLLVTGPTGTGKTTTLYACLNFLNNGRRKINTLEDPVEYTLAGIRQAAVSDRFGLGFNVLLTNILRQSPDIIMIGEIRDEETATTAIRAANSGHLVLASLHAPVASAAIHSLFALEANPYFLSGCLLGIMAQRLIRTLCPTCRVEYDISEAPETFRDIQDFLKPGEGRSIFGPRGCDDCLGTGYGGRTGLFEIMTMNRQLRNLIAEARPRQEIEDVATRSGMVEFRRGALLKVAQGVTSTEDLLRDIPAEFLGLED